MTECGNDAAFVELYATDQVRACCWDVQDIGQQYGMGACITIRLETNAALPNGQGGEVTSEPFDSKGFDSLVALECRAIVEDLVVGTGVIVTMIIMGDGDFEHR